MVVTLITDWGLRDASAALLKAHIATADSSIQCVDVSHMLQQGNVPQAAYVLRGIYQHYPPGTVHFVATGMAPGADAELIILRAYGQLFVATNNGVLPAAFPQPDAALQYRLLCNYATHPDWRQAVALRITGHLILGDLPIITPTSLTPPSEPFFTPMGLVCGVHHIDSFGNVVLGCSHSQFQELVGDKPFLIGGRRGGQVTSISQHYNDVPEGQPLCRFNSYNLLEVAVNRGSAADLLGLTTTTYSELPYRSIRIRLT